MTTCTERYKHLYQNRYFDEITLKMEVKIYAFLIVFEKYLIKLTIRDQKIDLPIKFLISLHMQSNLGQGIQISYTQTLLLESMSKNR